MNTVSHSLGNFADMFHPQFSDSDQKESLNHRYLSLKSMLNSVEGIKKNIKLNKELQCKELDTCLNMFLAL